MTKVAQILRTLADGPATKHDIVMETGIDVQYVSATLSKLKANKYVRLAGMTTRVGKRGPECQVYELTEAA